jgi:hypothetical protein
MDHSEAVTMKAVERYALGDLSVSEVEEFERHFFDCPQCSEDLRLLSVLQENARAVLMEQNPGPQAAPVPTEERVSWWKFWLQPRLLAPALAAVVLGILGGYEAGIGRSAAPQIIAASYALPPLTRGEETVISAPRDAQAFSISFDRLWERSYDSYTAVLRGDPGGAERYSMRFGPVAPGQSTQVVIPARSLPSGRYLLVISASDGTEVGRYAFRLQLP